MLSSKGELFQYDSESRLTAFEYHPSSSSSPTDSILICIPGLTDGFLGLPYLNELASSLTAVNTRLIQPWLSSSYLGYGTSSLDKDVEELGKLVVFLSEKYPSCSGVFLLGHSTGCQIACRFLSSSTSSKSKTNGVILQGAVSDREYMSWTNEKEMMEMLDLAKGMIEKGQGQECLPRRADSLMGAAMTALRYHSLYSRLGDDDLFSSDLTPQELSQLFSTITTPMMLVLSGADEYVPPHVDPQKIILNIGQHCPGFRFGRVIQGANHALDDNDHQVEFCSIVNSFIEQTQ